MFRDHRTAGHWFPKTMYITRFQESGVTTLANYDEDIDVTTGTVKGVELSGDSLSTWKEATLPYRFRGDDQRHNAVWIGWNNRSAGKDTTKMGKVASYSLTLSDSLRAALTPSENSAIFLSLTATKDKPGPRPGPKDTTKADTSKAGKARADSIKRANAEPKPAKKKEEADTIPIELTVELIDAAGHTAKMPLARYGTIRRPLETKIYRREGRDATRFASTFEMVLQTFVIPVGEFAKTSPAFDPKSLKTIRLLFDKSVAGTVVVSDIGISPKIDPAYMAGYVP
jgi:hypothetical protein